MEGGPSPIRLLLVDDEAEFLGAMTRALARRNFAVEGATNGTIALELLRRREFDVVVLDVKMPGIGGVEVFDTIRKDRPGLPVILLTGHGNIKEAFETSRAGVFEYLTKPCDVEDLARMVRRAHSSRGAASPVEEEAMRVLLVDDESDFLDSLSPALRRRGMRVVAASSAEEALTEADRSVFDVALVDLKMPGMGGITLIRRLREKQPRIEVIVVTGKATTGETVAALRAGAFDVLPKPQDVETLAGRMRDAFRSRLDRLREDREKEVEEILRGRPD